MVSRIKQARAEPRKWPAESVEMWPISNIVPYEKNPRTHPAAQITLLAELMKRRGVDQPIVVDEDGSILKGHGRRLAAIKAGFTEYPVVIHRGLSDADKVAVRIEDNQVSLLAGWDEVLIRGEMKLLSMAGYELTLLGFNHTDLLAFSTALPNMDGQDRGNLLGLINVTVADPSHVVAEGQSFLLSGRHHLVCTSVIDGWPIWMPLLKDGSLFCPYPGVFVPFCVKAKTNDLVMVQPDGYIAGHILDRYNEVHGDDSIKVL